MSEARLSELDGEAVLSIARRLLGWRKLDHFSEDYVAELAARVCEMGKIPPMYKMRYMATDVLRTLGIVDRERRYRREFLSFDGDTPDLVVRETPLDHLLAVESVDSREEERRERLRQNGRNYRKRNLERHRESVRRYCRSHYRPRSEMTPDELEAARKEGRERMRRLRAEGSPY